MQILRYCLVSWENELRNNKKHLTPIIPFIFYHGKYKSGFNENFKDYFEIDDRKIMLFEYITLKSELSEKKFNEIITELKGDEMPSLAEIWMERGEERGGLNELYNSVKIGLELKFQQISKKQQLSS